MIDINLISKFSSVHRFSGTFLFQAETVPDHSVEMALLCLNFAELVPESDKKELCYRCVIHDFEESITSDVPRPIKHKNPKIKELIDAAAREMLQSKSSVEFTEEVFSAKDINDINGFLVHIADRVQCYMKMSREVHDYGNKSLKDDLCIFRSSISDLITEISESKLMEISSKNKLTEYLINLITNL